MGLEAVCQLVTPDGPVAVKAVLESDALILRGGFRKTFVRATVENPRISGDHLLFDYAGQSWELALPSGQAAKWLKKLTTPAPTLAAKLGVDATRRVLVHGDLSDPALAEALSDAITEDPQAATQGLIVADTPDALNSAVIDLSSALPRAALWVVYPKGARSTLPDSVVRRHMRSLGYIDTKTSAVSPALTATRFSPRS